MFLRSDVYFIKADTPNPKPYFDCQMMGNVTAYMLVYKNTHLVHGKMGI